MTRRGLLRNTGLTALAGLGATLLGARRAGAVDHFTVTHTEAEWRKLLTPEQFHILREQGTEPPESSPLDHVYTAGTYICAGCALPLFSSTTKFDSGTGWPSFYQPLPHAISTHMAAICQAMPAPSQPPRVAQAGNTNGKIGEAL